MFDPVGTSKKWSATGVIYAIMLSNLFLWNHSLRTQTNLHHCSPEETVRGERVTWVAKCCFSVNIVRSCRDIGEMQWNRVSSRPSWYRTCFGPGIIHCVHLLFFGYQFLNISNPKLCLRTFVWKWGHTRHHGTGLICYVKLRSRVFSFELKEQMLRIGLCVIHFFASDVNAWTRCYICSIMVPTFAWKQLVGAGRLAYRVALSASGAN